MSDAATNIARRCTFRFGVFELDTQAGELRKSGVRIKLQPQPSQILALLLENPGKVVTREELSEKLWPADTYVEFDRSLNRAIVKLRESLGDSAESPRFIETLPKRGYRFIAPVTRSPISPSKLAARLLPKRWDRWELRGLVVVALAAATVLGYLVLRQARHMRSAAIRSIVVLPLDNLSTDAGQEYFADGITDELITNLAKIQSLRVVSRTTAMHFKGAHRSLPQIARELGVDAVVEGSVSRSGAKMRIRAQLVRGATDEHVWANSYERNLTDAVALQAEVARDIADEIEIKLSPQEKAALRPPLPVNAEAYETYLKARHFYEKRTVENDRKSIQLFRQAIALDPNFAAAYAGLADALALCSYLGDVSPTEIIPEAKSAVASALALNRDLVEAHISSGWIKLSYDWDWAGVEQEVQRALDLNPNSAAAHQLYGNYYLAMGQTANGIAEHERARQLDPLSPSINRDLGRALYYARRYDDALKQFQQTLDLDPNFAGVVQAWISWCYEKKGLRGEAIDAFLKLKRADGADDAVVRDQEQRYRHYGWIAFWRQELKPRSDRPPGSTEYFSALAYARVGDNEDALRTLRREIELHTVWVGWINIDPELDWLRSDTRFQQLVRITGR